MNDADVSKNLNKTFPRKRQPLEIEAVTRVVPARDPWRTAQNFRGDNEGHGLRMIPMSLPRVRWLDREEI